jgi:hypothetical protein
MWKMFDLASIREIFLMFFSSLSNNTRNTTFSHPFWNVLYHTSLHLSEIMRLSAFKSPLLYSFS